LRDPSFIDPKKVKPLIIQEKNSTRLEIATNYNPLSKTLSFINCLEENEAIKSFFNTLSYHKVGFTVEVWELQTEAGNWGLVPWGDSKWGGFDEGFGYGTKYYFKIASNNFTQASTTGKFDLSVILQKTEVGFVNS